MRDLNAHSSDALNLVMRTSTVPDYVASKTGDRFVSVKCNGLLRMYPGKQLAKKTPYMETLFQFYDETEDFVIATALRLRRSLAWKPRERRRVPRTSPAPAKRRQQLLAD